MSLSPLRILRLMKGCAEGARSASHCQHEIAMIEAPTSSSDLRLEFGDSTRVPVGSARGIRWVSEGYQSSGAKFGEIGSSRTPVEAQLKRIRALPCSGRIRIPNF